MTTQQILDKASITAFEADLHGLNLPQITQLVDDKLGALLQEHYDTDGIVIPKFNEDQIKTLLDYENLRYMMETCKKKPDQQPMTLDEAIEHARKG